MHTLLHVVLIKVNVSSGGLVHHCKHCESEINYNVHVYAHFVVSLLFQVLLSSSLKRKLDSRDVTRY